MNRDQYTAKRALTHPDSLAAAVGASAAIIAANAANAERWGVIDIAEYRRLARAQGGVPPQERPEMFVLPD